MLKLSRISLNFGGVKALSELSLWVAPGSLHGLVGPNGAGKTTAMNVVSGLVRPSSGGIAFQGKAFTPEPHRLASLGLARTFQASALIDSLDALGNVLLGGYASTRSGIASCALHLPFARREERALRSRAEEALARVGYAGRHDAPVAELSTWQRRQIEIARALLSRPKLLLLDEPAAGLTASEVDSLKWLLLDLRDSGNGELSILLIEHNVPLVFSLCDTVTAMALGRDIAHGKPEAVRGHPDVIRSYLGTRATAPACPALASPSPASPVPTTVRSGRPAILTLEHVSAGYDPITVLHDISLEIRAGETVALFGPNGAGKTTLLNTIVGERRPMSGAATFQGRRIERLSVHAIVRLGIGIVPQGGSVLARQSVEDNLLISMTGLGLGGRERRARAEEVLARFPSLALRRRSLGASLSGGERQMLAIAKALVRRPALLLLDEPSIGLAPVVVDEVGRIVAELSADGLAVLIGEQSVDWVLPIATRAYAITAGRIVAEGPPAQLSNADALAAQYLGVG